MAQTQKFMRQAQIHLIEEASQDTYSAPGGAGAGMFLAQNVTFSTDAQNYERNDIRGDLLKMDDVPAGVISATIGFEVLLKGSGSAGTAPEWGEALKACGYEDTTSATGGTVTYTPLGTFDGAGGNPGPSYSVSILEDGVRYAIAGAFGNVVFNLAVGSPGMMQFTFTGAFQAVAADALESPTYNTTVAPAFNGATAAINFGGAYTPIGVETLTLDTGNVVTLGRDVNSTYGVYGSRITDRRPTGTFDPEMVDPTSFDYWGTWTAGTSGTIATGTIGGTSGNRWSLSVGRSVFRTPSWADNGGIRKLSVPFAVTAAATDVEGTNAEITLLMT